MSATYTQLGVRHVTRWWRGDYGGDAAALTNGLNLAVFKILNQVHYREQAKD